MISSFSVNGSWSAWGPWSSDCLVACDATVRNRTRTCDNPSPDPEGAPCNGDAYLEEACVCQGDYILNTDFYCN